MKLDRVSSLSKRNFIEDYLVPNRPVVVTDAIVRWNKREAWTGEYFADHFGTADVQVYDDLFKLETICTLQRYFDQYWYKPPTNGKPVPYVRWYTKLKPVEFVWADEAFASISSHWSLPYFLPDTGYLLPYCSNGKTITPVLDPFPGKGLFISGSGARTRLHKDPWGSDAILCQMLGEKRVVMFKPDKENHVKAGDHVVDIENPDAKLFASFSATQPDIEDVLVPDEILFIPAGWFHHVRSLSNSISLTWNFVLMDRWPSFLTYLLNPIRADEREILQYFSKY